MVSQAKWHRSENIMSAAQTSLAAMNKDINILLRSATQADADAVSDVYLASRKAHVAFAPLAHTDAQVRQWIADLLLPTDGVTLAMNGTQVVGMMATSQEGDYGWIDHLYVAPAFVGAGIGARLLAQAKTGLGPPLRLYTFQANAGARRFYERHGFEAIAFSDGQDNEEKCPDMLYQWMLDKQRRN